MFMFFYPKQFLEKTNKDILNCCINLHLALTNGPHRDIDCVQLYHKYKLMKTVLSGKVKKDLKSPHDVLNYILDNGPMENFTNVTAALWILLIFPIFVATGERS